MYEFLFKTIKINQQKCLKIFIIRGIANNIEIIICEFKK